MENIGFKLKIWFIPCEENDYRPKFLNGGTLFNIALGLLILKIIAAAFMLYVPNTVFFADLTKSSIIAMTNQTRQTYGVGTLRENEKLNQAAMQKAQDMLANDYFAHQSPQGISPWYWFGQLGYNYKVAGENLAIGFIDSQEVLNAWENSPSHKENLLNPKFQETGIAVATGDFQGSKATVVVQFFGTPASNIFSGITQTSAPIKSVNQTKPVDQPIEKPAEKADVVQNNDIKILQLEVSDTTVVKGETNTNEDSSQGLLPAEANKSEQINKFLGFMIFTYPSILQKIIFYVLLIIIIALILNIFIEIKHQDKRLIAKTTIFIILLILFVLSDKELILQIIPHNLLI